MRRGVRRFAVLLCCVAVLGLLGVGGGAPAGAFPTGVIDMLVTQRLGGADCQLGLVDLVTGTVTPLPHVGGDVCMSDIAYAPDGRLFGLATNAGQPPGPIHLFQLDTTTGQVDADLGQFGSFNAFADPTEAGLAFDSSGTVFATMVGTDAGCGTSATCLYRANLSNIAAAEFVGAAPAGTSLDNLAISCADAGFTIEPQPGTMNAKTKSATPPGGVRSDDAGPNALLDALELDQRRAQHDRHRRRHEQPAVRPRLRRYRQAVGCRNHRRHRAACLHARHDDGHGHRRSHPRRRDRRSGVTGPSDL